jgi:hypothetical protein
MKQDGKASKYRKQSQAGSLATVEGKGKLGESKKEQI